MKTFIALFRGINVGGHNRLSMQELAAILEKLGLKNISTYIQSGNAVFQSTEKSGSGLAEEISLAVGNAIESAKGFKPAIMLISLDAIEHNPFDTSNGKALHFIFLADEPTHADLKQLEAPRSVSEEFKLIGKVFYLYTPDGFGRSKLAAKIEKALGVPTTARNWNTVDKLRSMAKTPGSV